MIDIKKDLLRSNIPHKGMKDDYFCLESDAPAFF